MELVRLLFKKVARNMGLFQNSGIFFKYYVHSEISDDMNKGQKSNNPAKSICQMAC